MSPQMKRTAIIGVLLALALPALAQQAPLPSYIDRPSDAAGVFAIWPGSGVGPGSEQATWHEQSRQFGTPSAPSRQVRNVVIPTLTMFKPAPGTANGTALIVAPGGAFYFLMVDYEGYDVARWLSRCGVTSFVLRYRVGHTPEDEAGMRTFNQELKKALNTRSEEESRTSPIMKNLEAARVLAEEDGRQAIRYVRSHAREWSLDPERIGITGFSAGGGVVMGPVMKHDTESRPDFAAPIYGAVGNITSVPADAPPLFIAIADDDRLVSPLTSTHLDDAWHAAGKSAELHVFRKGAHGFGMKKQNLPSDAWIDIFKTWLDSLGYLKPAAGQH